ncbi:MAG: ferrous iron transport protein B [Bergeyella sp.]|nr:ferrous iron transport protein B [Bergeyella sp.]
MPETQYTKYLLVGNPNVGKSSLFNALCNTKQKTGNYAGVTVSSSKGICKYQGKEFEIVDLPGVYSLYPSSADERISSDYILEKNYHGVIYVLEVLNLKRGLLLLQQIQDLEIPVLIVINQIDLVERKGIKIDFSKLSSVLSCKVVSTNAKKNLGITELKEAIFREEFSSCFTKNFEIPSQYKTAIEALIFPDKYKNTYEKWFLVASGKAKYFAGSTKKNPEDFCDRLQTEKRLQTQETIRRYKKIDNLLADIISEKNKQKNHITEKIDQILVHKIWGYTIFLLVLLTVFQLVFFISSFPKEAIEDLFFYLSSFTEKHLPPGPVNSLISKGIIPGIGGIMAFAPQIGILLYALYLLEDSGYMARIVFLTDRFLRPFGLNGKSIIPLVSATACAIPAILSTRNIESHKERLITILVTPFMTCSARLPIYSVIITLIIPDQYFMGWISYGATVLLFMYFLGFFSALFFSVLLHRTIKPRENSYLVMDMPTYKKPMFKKNLGLAWGKVLSFIGGAGRIIFFVSIIIWAFSYFGPAQENQSLPSKDVSLENSYLARAGKYIEPAIRPLGYDWKIGVGILTSFAAREVFVGTMSTLYRLENGDKEERMIEKMQRETKPNGEKLYSFATGISILLFYAFAMQCASTIIVVYKETLSLKWTVIQGVGMSTLAYIISFLAFQIFR